MMQWCTGAVHHTISFDLVIAPTFKAVACKYFSLNMNTSVIFFLFSSRGKDVEDTRADVFVVSEHHDALDTYCLAQIAEVVENLTDPLSMLISWRVVLLPPGVSFNLAARVVLSDVYSMLNDN
ncbi:hypothetical protein IMY05_015G0112100 [Salix suchowensis]|nr:hypothetical protein IMY05_015G0112100 [Salix suchowensis]